MAGVKDIPPYEKYLTYREGSVTAPFNAEAAAVAGEQRDKTMFGSLQDQGVTCDYSASDHRN